MKLSETDAKKVQDHIARHKLRCPCCDGNLALGRVSTFAESPPTSDNLTLTVVPLICGTCGHVAFFVAKAIGL
jgi:hypothetical protein